MMNTISVDTAEVKLPSSSDLVRRAYLYANAAHTAVGQYRKYTNTPYIEHPLAVAFIVSTVPHTDEMLAAALLHDTVEDTNTTIENIQEEFGKIIAGYVSWLTDVSTKADGRRAFRKAIDRSHTAKSPAAVQTIKLADLIHNSESIIRHDPKFARVYLTEKELLLKVLIKGDKSLQDKAWNILKRGKNELGM